MRWDCTLRRFVYVTAIVCVITVCVSVVHFQLGCSLLTFNMHTQTLSFSELPQLVKLDLQHNELQQIPCCLLELPSLTELNLSHNQLQEIPDIPEWSASLTALDLSYNRLESLPPSVVAPSICKLNIACNQLHQLPKCVSSFTTLQELDISGNPDIHSLPPEIESLPHLLH